MPCDKFTIDKSGKISVENMDYTNGLKLLNKNLTILRISTKGYLLNKESISSLNNYAEQNLEENPVYLLVGRNKEGSFGLASRITDLERLNRIVKEVKKIN